MARPSRMRSPPSASRLSRLSSTTRKPSPGRTRSCRGSRPGSAGFWTRRMCAPSAAARRSSTARASSPTPTPASSGSSASISILATGSEPAALPHLPFGGDVLSSTEALALKRVPERLAVVGAGYIGMELGMAFAKLGAQVTVVEALPKILPLYDEELTLPVARRAADLGIDSDARRAGAWVRQGRASGRGRRRARRRRSRPTRFWSRSGAGRAPKTSGSNGWISRWPGRSSASTTDARPRCATSGRSAT